MICFLQLFKQQTFLQHYTCVQPITFQAAKTKVFHYFSNMADIIEAGDTVVVGQDEADVPAPLPSAADLSKLLRITGQQENEADQQNWDREDEDHHESGWQEEAVLARVKGAVPAEEERMHRGHGQGAVA